MPLLTKMSDKLQSVEFSQSASFNDKLKFVGLHGSIKPKLPSCRLKSTPRRFVSASRNTTN